MLGFTGMYPQNYDYGSTSGINWYHYKEMKMNYWQGWWLGDDDHGYSVLNNLNLPNIDMSGYFQPDTLRWAGYGRVEIINAARTTGSFQIHSSVTMRRSCSG